MLLLLSFLLLTFVLFGAVLRLLGLAPDQKRKRQVPKQTITRRKTVRFDTPRPVEMAEAEIRHREAAEAIQQVREDMARRLAAEVEAKRIAPISAAPPEAAPAKTPTEKGFRLAAESTTRQQRAAIALQAAEAPPAPQPEAPRKAVLQFLPDSMWEAKLIGAPPVLLQYRDAAGAITNRVVLPQNARCGPAPAGGYEVKAFSGFCMLRKAQRHFLVARIDSVADPETGELVNLDALVVAHIERA